MFLISSCSCLCAIYSSQVLSREWRCSWSSADMSVMLQLDLNDQQCCLLRCTYIRDLVIFCDISFELIFLIEWVADTIAPQCWGHLCVLFAVTDRTPPSPSEVGLTGRYRWRKDQTQWRMSGDGERWVLDWLEIIHLGLIITQSINP